MMMVAKNTEEEVWGRDVSHTAMEYWAMMMGGEDPSLPFP